MALGFTQFLFNEAISGWSETYYGDITNLTTMEGQAKLLLSFRQKMLGSLVKLVGVRIGFANGRRNVRQYRIGTSDWPVVDTFWDKTQEPDVAMRLRLETGVGRRRIFMVRGNPELAVTGGNLQDLTALDTAGRSWGDRVNDFSGILEAGGVLGPFWGIKVRNQPGPYTDVFTAGISPASVLTNLAYGSDNTRIVATLDPTTSPLLYNDGTNIVPAAPGQRYIIRGYKGGIHVNGVWVLQEMGVNNTFIFGPHRRPVALATTAGITGNGVTVYSATFSLDLITRSINVSPYWYNRRSGRPFGLQAGRRLVR